ncbi:MAG: LytTR family DNA-binding domain-containing protein [Eubacterium sp.]|nr:LytTR family DNA-binding domain-containing protein [Eubacterium sp.]
MNIAICDDEVRGRERIRTLLEKEFSQAQTCEFDSGMKLLEKVKEGYRPDIVLLDIAMEGMDGMETARRLKELSDAILIFVTGVKEQVFEAFDVGAFHYLMKPIDQDKMTDVLKRAIQEAEKKKSAPRSLLVKVDGSHRRIPVDEILYVENSGRKVILHMKTECLEYYERMNHLEEVLGDGFYRCHRGYLVALSAVSGYDHESITVGQGDKIYLAKQKYGEFVKRYCDFLKE